MRIVLWSRSGAVHYLQKPLRPMELVNAIQEAIAKDQSRRRTRQRQQRVLEGIAILTAGEREVVRMVAEGKTNKVIASRLGISLRTVELRRANVMKKLRLKSPTALLHLAILATRNGKHRSNGWHTHGVSLARLPESVGAEEASSPATPDRSLAESSTNASG